MIKGPITHQIVPGDLPSGSSRAYREAHLILVPPNYPVMVRFRNAIPAAYLPLLKGPGAPIAGRSVYRGVTRSELQPVIQKRDPWT